VTAGSTLIQTACRALLHVVWEREMGQGTDEWGITEYFSVQKS